MSNNLEIDSFLRSNDFERRKDEQSPYFGDYYTIYANNSILLRFSSSKSFESVDIRKNRRDETWYDIALVKSLLYEEKCLTGITPFNDYCAFIEKELNNIAELFSENNYSETKQCLKELGNERVNQLFPDIL